MLQYCLKYMRTLIYQNKLLGGNSCDGVLSALAIDGECEKSLNELTRNGLKVYAVCFYSKNSWKLQLM
jgi:hypothetical protein